MKPQFIFSSDEYNDLKCALQRLYGILSDIEDGYFKCECLSRLDEAMSILKDDDNEV